jgi:CCR4-NOT transcriptional regulation complex NOT5 subunit
MKKKVSLFNNENVEKKSIKSINSNFFLKPTYFGKFSDETLFYIFYFMPKDTLQLLAAEELFKRKWRYNTDNTLWFSSDTNEEKGSESFMYFNPNEWKTMKYAYGPLNMKSFLTDEIFKYARQLNLDK